MKKRKKDKNDEMSAFFGLCSIPKLRFFKIHQFLCLHSERGQMTSATATNAVPVLEEVCAGTTRSGACGSI